MSDIHTFQMQKLSDDIIRISEALNASEPNELANLQEHIFVNVFLPLFAGDDPLPYKVSLDTWVNYAGSPFKQVNVINQKNEILFTVPALFNRDSVKPMNGGNIPLAHIVTTASQYARIHPTQGQNYLVNELAKCAMVMHNDSSLMNDLQIWNKIFTRYNRQPLLLVKQEDKKESIQQELNCDFDLM